MFLINVKFKSKFFVFKKTKTIVNPINASINVCPVKTNKDFKLPVSRNFLKNLLFEEYSQWKILSKMKCDTMLKIIISQKLCILAPIVAPTKMCGVKIML